MHSSLQNSGRHFGDLGNVTVQSNGGLLSGVLDGVSSYNLLTGNNSIFGRGIILHASYDGKFINKKKMG
jgi:Cu/Zn superoxide dismutase